MMKGKQQLARALTQARDNYGTDAPSFANLERIMLHILGDESTPSGESLRQWHRDGVHPTNAPIEAMRVLAQIYGISLRDIHPTLERRWQHVLQLFDDWTVDELIAESRHEPNPNLFNFERRAC
jgi:hypothetical protein